jgi:Fe-S-cluster-containing hydrogenase component 2
MAHGRIVIDAERCKGCELCRFACPQDVIKCEHAVHSKKETKRQVRATA